MYIVEENKSIILHSFARKTKVSYYITFFQTLLKTFLAAFAILSQEIRLQGNAKNHLILLREKESKLLRLQE